MAVVKRRVPRLFVERNLDGSTLELDEREAHYLGNVLRLQRGDELVAFNGLGTERHASVFALQRRGATLELREPRAALPESGLALTLLQAMPKADAMDLIVQKATELGVQRILPVHTEFSVVKLDAERALRRTEHWQRIAQSACEQCGRHRPPVVGAPLELTDSLAALELGTLLALDPQATERFATVTRPEASMVLAVGPEGGFGGNDWRLLDKHGFRRVALGARVLRAETAAIAACAIAQNCWGDL
jgi:16S rRNA (uracil1498-N3)-methyltransferase